MGHEVLTVPAWGEVWSQNLAHNHLCFQGLVFLPPTGSRVFPRSLFTDFPGHTAFADSVHPLLLESVHAPVLSTNPC